MRPCGAPGDSFYASPKERTGYKLDTRLVSYLEIRNSGDFEDIFSPGGDFGVHFPGVNAVDKGCWVASGKGGAWNCSVDPDLPPDAAILAPAVPRYQLQ